MDEEEEGVCSQLQQQMSNCPSFIFFKKISHQILQQILPFFDERLRFAKLGRRWYNSAIFSVLLSKRDCWHSSFLCSMKLSEGSHARRLSTAKTGGLTEIITRRMSFVCKKKSRWTEQFCRKEKGLYIHGTRLRKWRCLLPGWVCSCVHRYIASMRTRGSSDATCA